MARALQDRPARSHSRCQTHDGKPCYEKTCRKEVSAYPIDDLRDTCPIRTGRLTQAIGNREVGPTSVSEP